MLHTDEQLMLSVKDGNRDAFRILTERHYTNTLKLYLSVCQKSNACGRPLSGNILTVMALRPIVPPYCQIQNVSLSHRQERLFETVGERAEDPSG